MTGSNKSGEAENSSPRESGEDSEDDIEILEESPCRRWSKRRQGVQQRDVPGIDASYLAMDTEEGMEVVWNEVRFSERRALREREDHIKAAFECLTELDHPNIVKLHSYWLDNNSEKRRIVFITEFMSSGSLRKFLKLTKRNDKKVHISSWKKWCIQILSALGYLHSCSPAIVHGNLTADTIFMQSNGLIKISSVAPDAIQNTVKTYKSDMKNLYYIAPEYINGTSSSSVDVYALGMCALEMAALEILPANGESSHSINEEQINKTIESLENGEQRDFIRACLTADHTKRPGVRQLLLHPVLFEVHSLKLLAAHALVNGPNDQYTIEEILQHQYKNETIIAEVMSRASPSDKGGSSPSTPLLRKYKLTDFTNTDKLEKFVEDVRYGVYPLFAFGISGANDDEKNNPPSSSPSSTRRRATEGGGGRENNVELDTRVTNMMCNIKPHEDGEQLHMTISLRLANKMNRQLSCLVSPTDEAIPLTDELVSFALISPVDHENVANLIDQHLKIARLQEIIPLKVSSDNSTNSNGLDLKKMEISSNILNNSSSSSNLNNHSNMNGNSSPTHTTNVANNNGTSNVVATSNGSSNVVATSNGSSNVVATSNGNMASR